MICFQCKVFSFGDTCFDDSSNCPTEGVGCYHLYHPVCGCDGRTYENACVARHLNCILQYSEGICSDGGDSESRHFLRKVEQRHLVDTAVQSTISGDCCLIPESQCNPGQEISCPLEFDPVCGCDYETYSNSCDARYYGCNRFWSPGECGSM